MKMLLKAGRFRGRTLNQTGIQSGGSVGGVGRRCGGQAAFHVVSGEEEQRPRGAGPPAAHCHNQLNHKKAVTLITTLCCTAFIWRKGKHTRMHANTHNLYAEQILKQLFSPTAGVLSPPTETASHQLEATDPCPFQDALSGIVTETIIWQEWSCPSHLTSQLTAPSVPSVWGVVHLKDYGHASFPADDQPTTRRGRTAFLYFLRLRLIPGVCACMHCLCASLVRGLGLEVLRHRSSV